MKRIILLRHAKTEPYDYNGDDFARNLTTRGISDCALITHALKKEGFSIDKILASPANRATQTAKLFATDFAIPKDEILYKQAIYYGMTTQDFLNLLSQTEENVETLLFVGHNPDIANFAYRLTENFNHYVPTCCAIVLETEVENWNELGEEKLRCENVFVPKTYK